jgi:hypothetical protein
MEKEQSYLEKPEAITANIFAKRLEHPVNCIGHFQHPRIRLYVDKEKVGGFCWEIACEFEQHRGFAQTVANSFC